MEMVCGECGNKNPAHWTCNCITRKMEAKLQEAEKELAEAQAENERLREGAKLAITAAGIFEKLLKKEA